MPNYLWVTFNVFNGSGLWQRAVVFRFPLDTLATGGALNYDHWSTTQHGSLRLTQGAADKMYWVSHTSSTQLRLFQWPENSNTINWWDINVAAWSAGAYSAPGPDGRNWLARVDPRITGAWAANGIIGAMWTANSGSGRPFPYVRVVRINELTKAVIDQPDLWSNNAAYAYPTACPNDRGHVGVTLFYGGGSSHISHVVGIWDDYFNSWQTALTRVSTNGPTEGKWGDYINCRRHSPNGMTWIASGYTLQGGTQASNVEPQYVHFGRRRDEDAVNRWVNS